MRVVTNANTMNDIMDDLNHNEEQHSSHLEERGHLEAFTLGTNTLESGALSSELRRNYSELSDVQVVSPL